MTELQSEPVPSSWAMPIAVGALSSFLLTAFVAVPFGIDDPGTIAGVCCCGVFLSVPSGFVPGALLVRANPLVSGIQAFSASFAAVLVAQVMWVVLLAMSVDPDKEARFETDLRESVRETLEEQPDLTPEQVDEVVEMMVEVTSYAPALTVAVCSLLAGVFGLVTVLILRPRIAPVDRYDPPPR